MPIFLCSFRPNTDKEDYELYLYFQSFENAYNYEKDLLFFQIFTKFYNGRGINNDLEWYVI